MKLIADAPVSADTEIPFFIYENANENADYILSANSFLLKAGESEATITITRPEGEIGENSTELTLNLDRNAAPKGFHMGLINYTTIELMGKNATIVSFTTKADLLTMQSDFKIRLEKLDGYKVESSPYNDAHCGSGWTFSLGDNTSQLFIVSITNLSGSTQLPYHATKTKEPYQ